MKVFAYGSLTWKIDFPVVKATPGFVRGYIRRFWQGSTDHRGVPGKPGRVVTMLKTGNETDVVWGILYETDSKLDEDLGARLDFRERGGYQRAEVRFYPYHKELNSHGESIGATSEPFNVETYIATTENPNYLGEAPVEVIAKQICVSIGPSGKNTEYALRLIETIRQIMPSTEKDDHLFELESAIHECLASMDVSV